MLLSTHDSTIQKRTSPAKQSWLANQSFNSQALQSFGQSKLHGAAVVWRARTRSFGNSWSMLRSPR